MDPIFAFTLTHKELGIDKIGQFLPGSVANWEELHPQLAAFQMRYGWKELLFLNTCNRVLFVLASDSQLSPFSLAEFYQDFNPELSEEQTKYYAQNTRILHSYEAVEHYFSVICSIESLVIGEREIIGQLKQAYHRCNEVGLCGDTIRLLTERAVVVAKEVYTETKIGDKPVSVVSLASRAFCEQGFCPRHSIALVGAGQSNRLMAELLQSKGYNSFTVYNRSKENGEKLANKLNAPYKALSELADSSDHQTIILCTASPNPIMNEASLEKMEKRNAVPNLVIDLSVPGDLEAGLAERFGFGSISIDDLRAISDANKNDRKRESKRAREIVANHVEAFQLAYKQRQIERSMEEIPERVKAIRTRAVEQVFQEEIASLDPASREILTKVVEYMEKKYIAIPMVVAKEAVAKELSRTKNSSRTGAPGRPTEH